MWSTLRTLQRSSPTLLFVGFVPTAIRNGLAVGGRFLLYDEFKRFLSTTHQPKHEPVERWWHSVVCGFSVGVVTTVLSQPADVVKSRMQGTVQRKRGVTPSVLQSAREIWNVEGGAGMKRGLTARIWKIGTGQAVIFSVYEHIVKLIA